MTHSNFIHLRCHSAYSLSEGAIKVKDLVNLCVDNSMPALGICDSNNMFGALEFSLTCVGAGVQPIMGTQLSLTPMDTIKFSVQQNPDQLVLLAKNEQGHLNLLELLSKSFVDAEDGVVPQISLEVLSGLCGGLICLTGGQYGTVNRLLHAGQEDKAVEVLNVLKDMFDDNLYMELHRHGAPEQIAVEDKLIELAYKMDIPLVATNNVFFSTKDMYQAHDALLCVAGGVVVDQKDRFKLNDQYYFKTAEEMTALFKDIPEAIENTLVIAKRCAYKTETIAPLLPEYPYLDGRSEIEALRDLTLKGLREHLEKLVFIGCNTAEEKSEKENEYMSRMHYELDIIEQMGFPGYFLIVADFIQWAKDQDIPVGPGRGSGAGSIVAWSLKVTGLDPIRFGLLFERFLNPERVSMPDFDIDFCQDRRGEVITYVQKQYGRDKVGQIITFGKLQARAVLRDVGRVLAIPYPQVDRICKLIPNNPANPTTLVEAMKTEPALQNERDSDPTVGKLIELAMKLEGLYRHASTHAAGVVISDRPLHQLVPLYRDPKSDMPVTQFNMKFVEQAGLVKFDFLGLKTLSIIQMAVNLINKRDDVVDEIDITTIPLDDKKSYDMMSRGDTVGVFQLESAGMRKVLMQMKPDRLEDIIAVVALYRPGPMENIPTYIECKHGKKKVEYLHPILEKVLKETFGIPVYQEQVMRMAQALAGYTLGGADLLRRAMGKKIQAEMDEQRQIFKDGARKHHAVDEKLSDAIFDQINAFAGYGFNKSHAAAYALVAYQTAWLKANYPVEFMVSTMTYDMGNTDKLNIFKQDLKNSGIELLRPDVNYAYNVFSAEAVKSEGVDKLAVRYAMSALKNVGEGAIKSIVDTRNEGGKFKDIYDFFERVDSKNINRRMFENLCKAGAFDSLNSNRKQMVLSADSLARYGASVQDDKNSAQDNLFGDSISEMSQPALFNSGDYSEIDRLKEEFKAVGFYMSTHPLSIHKDKMNRLGIVEYGDVISGRVRGDVLMLAGIVGSVRYLTTQKGNRMAIADFTDATGAYSVLFFEEAAERVREFLVVGNSVIMRVSKSTRGEGDEKEIRFNGSSVTMLDNEIAKSADGIKIFIRNKAPLATIKEIFDNQSSRGRGLVLFILDTEMGEVEMRLKDKYNVSVPMRRAIKAVDDVIDVIDI